MTLTDIIKERDRLYAHAASLRRAAQAWSEELTCPNRSGNVGRDCKALGWNSPDELYRAADTMEASAPAFA